MVAPYTTVHRRLPERDEILLVIDRYVVNIGHPAILLNPLTRPSKIMLKGKIQLFWILKGYFHEIQFLREQTFKNHS